MSNEPEVDVERRRKADKPTQRAEAPIRRQTGGTGGAGGGGSYQPSGGGFNIPTKGKLGGCGGILILILIVGYYLLSGGLGSTPPANLQLLIHPLKATRSYKTYPPTLLALPRFLSPGRLVRSGW